MLHAAVESWGMQLSEIFGTESPVVGMVHLGPLPGAPRSNEPLDAVVERAVEDAERLEAGGVDGLMVENFGDAPFYPDDVPKHTVASMTRAAGVIADAVDLPLGVNVLRNDAEAAVSVAAAVGADYVRVNVHAGARVTDQGLVEGRAHETMRLRERLDTGVRVFADVDVKHSAPLGSEQDLAAEFLDTVERGLADAVVVSGSGTGRAVDADRLRIVAETQDESERDVPLFVGSGVDESNVAELLSRADGVVVGTALKEDGETTNPVDADRVRSFVKAARRA